MPTYTAYFRTDADWASEQFKAKSPRHALAKARRFQEQHDGELLFQEYDGGRAVNEIEIAGTEGDNLAVWRDEDLQLRLASTDLLEALEAQTEAAQAVVDSWEAGDLAGAVRGLDTSLDGARSAVAKAKGGAS